MVAQKPRKLFFFVWSLAWNFGGQAALSTKTMPLEDGADGSRSLGNDQESVQDLAGVRGGLCSVVERVYMPLVSASA